MTKEVQELMMAIEFGKEVIEEYKEKGEEIPAFVYEKMIEKQALLIKELMNH